MLHPRPDSAWLMNFSAFPEYTYVIVVGTRFLLFGIVAVAVFDVHAECHV